MYTQLSATDLELVHLLTSCPIHFSHLAVTCFCFFWTRGKTESVFRGVIDRERQRRKQKKKKREKVTQREGERLWQKYFTIRTELGLMIHPLELRDTHFKCRRMLHLTSGSHLALHLSGFCCDNCVAKKKGCERCFGRRKWRVRSTERKGAQSTPKCMNAPLTLNRWVSVQGFEQTSGLLKRL